MAINKISASASKRDSNSQHLQYGYIYLDRMEQFCAKMESFWDLKPKAESYTGSGMLLLKLQIRQNNVYVLLFLQSYTTTKTDTKQAISLEWYPTSEWPVARGFYPIQSH